ncbi:MAG: hypothetical protein HRU75_11370 [Planctomycetia bacterium]|nr:MAG: hypothetical protein HRU75_11370 [Planctomycetia bacterium]
MQRILIAAIVLGALIVAGCEQKPPQSNSGTTPPAGAAKQDAAEPKKDAAPAPKPEAGHGGHGGPVVDLGETTVDGMKVRASRDAGEIKAGGDSPVDIWIDGGLGDAAAVRLWIGIESAKGSLKAKAENEDGHWHTHSEVPDPLPADSKLWVEIEHKDGKKSLCSFDLNR